MPRPFLQWPDPRLSESAKPVREIGDEVRAIWDEMLAAMYAMPGVGLAAPQLGISMRLAVLDCSPKRDTPLRLANPVIVSAGVELTSYEEGSPNLPGVAAVVKRPSPVTVSYLDDTGAETTQTFDALWATSVQHQIDHLDGKLFIDRLSPMKRKMLLGKFKKRRKRGD